MKNIFLYYLAIIIPFAAIVYLAKTDFDSEWLVALLVFYAFIYRTFTDYSRLVSKNIMHKNDFWKLLIPGSRLKYFRALYLP